MFENGTVFTVDEPRLNPMAVSEISSYLSYFVGTPTNLTPDEPPPWEGGWSPVTDDGRLSKRISAWVRNTYDHKMSKYDLSQIGVYASRLQVPVGSTITIVDKFDWNPGAYGDDDSCYFRSRRQVLPILHHMNARAGIVNIPNRKPGRCLLLDADKGETVAFNFYGITFDEGGALWQAALGREEVIPAKLFTVAGSVTHPIYINHKMGLDLYGSDDGEELYINSDFAISQSINRHLYCEGCNVELNPDWELRRQSRSIYVDEPDYNAAYCDSCYEVATNSNEPRHTIARPDAYKLKGVKPKFKSKKTVDPIEGRRDWATVEQTWLRQWFEEPPAIETMTDYTVTYRHNAVDAIVDQLFNISNLYCACASCRPRLAAHVRVWMMAGGRDTDLDGLTYRAIAELFHAGRIQPA
jgi:hypothetical protein